VSKHLLNICFAVSIRGNVRFNILLPGLNLHANSSISPEDWQHEPRNLVDQQRKQQAFVGNFNWAHRGREGGEQLLVDRWLRR
jgi:hypothetical protein